MSDERGRPPAGGAQVEWEKDRLVALVGRRQLDDPRSPVWMHAAFLEWWVRDAAERLTGAERARLAADADAFAERVLARGVGRRLGVRRVGAACRLVAPDEPVPLATALTRAAGHGCAPSLDLAVAAGSGRELWDEPCAEWVALPEGVDPGRYVSLIVAGESMTPLLHPGDRLLVRLDPAVARDAVVVARRPDDGYVVKRVGRVGARTVELLSLNPDYPPVEIPRDESLVLGTVVLCWCTHERADRAVAAHGA